MTRQPSLTPVLTLQHCLSERTRENRWRGHTLSMVLNTLALSKLYLRAFQPLLLLFGA